MFANECWATACEKLMGIEVPPRAQYLRVISCELNRIASHMIALGTMAMDIGAVTPFPWALREREYINDFIEELCGARLTYNYHRIGGVSFDMPEGLGRQGADAGSTTSSPLMDEFDRLITLNDIYVKRLANVAVITGRRGDGLGPRRPEPARLRREVGPAQGRRVLGLPASSSSTCPSARASTARSATAGTASTCASRSASRAAKILRQALEKIDEHPEDDIVGKLPKKLKPEGEAYARVESARGDMGCYVIGKGAEEPYRARFRTGSFTAMGIIEAKSPGLFLADLVALIARFDVVAPEIESLSQRSRFSNAPTDGDAGRETARAQGRKGLKSGDSGVSSVPSPLLAPLRPCVLAVVLGRGLRSPISLPPQHRRRSSVPIIARRFASTTSGSKMPPPYLRSTAHASKGRRIRR